MVETPNIKVRTMPCVRLVHGKRLPCTAAAKSWVLYP